MKIHASTKFDIVMTALIGVMLLVSIQFEPAAGMYVWIGGIPGFLFGLIVLINDLRDARAGHAPKGMKAEAKAGAELAPAVIRRRIFRIILWITALYLAIWLLGFKVALPAFFLAYLSIEAKSKWYTTIAITAFVAVFLVVFDKISYAYWPVGIVQGFIPWWP